MKRGRSLVPEIRKSETFGSLSYRQRDLFQGLIEVADDQGRLVGAPQAVRSAVWGYDEIQTHEVQDDLEKLASGEDPFIAIYQVSGKTYIQIINWWRYQQMQWAQESSYPAPEGWTDRVRFQAAGGKIITRNWNLVGGFEKKSEITPEQLEELHNWEPTDKESNNLPESLPEPLPSQSGSRQDSGLYKDKDKEKDKAKKSKENDLTTQAGLVAPDPDRDSELVTLAWKNALAELTGSGIKRVDLETYILPLQVDRLCGDALCVRATNHYQVDFIRNKSINKILEKSLAAYLQRSEIEIVFIPFEKAEVSNV